MTTSRTDRRDDERRMLVADAIVLAITDDNPTIDDRPFRKEGGEGRKKTEEQRCW